MFSFYLKLWENKQWRWILLVFIIINLSAAQKKSFLPFDFYRSQYFYGGVVFCRLESRFETLPDPAFWLGYGLLRKDFEKNRKENRHLDNIITPPAGRLTIRFRKRLMMTVSRRLWLVWNSKRAKMARNRYFQSLFFFYFDHNFWLIRYKLIFLETRRSRNGEGKEEGWAWWYQNRSAFAWQKEVCD